MKILVTGTAGFISHHLAPPKPFDTSGRAELKLSEVPFLGELLKTPSPFALSKLFTRKLKGGIEKQGRESVGWLLPPQLWGKVGMGGVVEFAGNLTLGSGVIET